MCGSPFKTRIVVHDPENVAGFSTSLGASAGSSASGNLPIRSRNRRTSWFPENVEKSFPRSESRLGTPPTPQTFKPFAKRLNVWNVIYRSPRTIDNNFLFRCYFFLRSLSFSLFLKIKENGGLNHHVEGSGLAGGLVCRSRPVV